MTENEAIEELKFNNEKCLKQCEGACSSRKNNDCACQDAVIERMLDELLQYREIGTVEECREAVGKQKPQKPKDSLKIDPVIDENGAYVDADTTVYLLCPNCGEMVGIEDNCDRFCHECGQAIDNENLEGMEDENT